MSDLRELYQEIILDHNRKPKNFGDLPNFNRTAKGHNPLCGDMVTIYLIVDDGVVQDVKFDGKIKNNMKITDIDKEIKKKIVSDRQKEYGDYQYNFTILAELFTLILAANLKKKIKPHQVGQLMMTLKLFRSTRGYKADNYHDLSVYNDMTFDLHKKDIDKNDKNR